jgi:hypothetical protein
MCRGDRWDKWDKWELLQIVGELDVFSSILLSQRWENGNLLQNALEIISEKNGVSTST